MHQVIEHRQVVVVQLSRCNQKKRKGEIRNNQNQHSNHKKKSLTARENQLHLTDNLANDANAVGHRGGQLLVLRAEGRSALAVSQLGTGGRRQANRRHQLLILRVVLGDVLAPEGDAKNTKH